MYFPTDTSRTMYGTLVLGLVPGWLVSAAILVMQGIMFETWRPLVAEEFQF